MASAATSTRLFKRTAKAQGRSGEAAAGAEATSLPVWKLPQVLAEPDQPPKGPTRLPVGSQPLAAEDVSLPECVAELLCRARVCWIGLLLICAIRWQACSFIAPPSLDTKITHKVSAIVDVVSAVCCSSITCSVRALRSCFWHRQLGPLLSILFAALVSDLLALAILLLARWRPTGEGAGEGAPPGLSPLGVWECLLISSIALQLSLCSSVWEIYKALRTSAVEHGEEDGTFEVSPMELLCEEENIKLLDDCEAAGPCGDTEQRDDYPASGTDDRYACVIEAESELNRRYGLHAVAARPPSRDDSPRACVLSANQRLQTISPSRGGSWVEERGSDAVGLSGLGSLEAMPTAATVPNVLMPSYDALSTPTLDRHSRTPRSGPSKAGPGSNMAPIQGVATVSSVEQHDAQQLAVSESCCAGRVVVADTEMVVVLSGCDGAVAPHAVQENTLEVPAEAFRDTSEVSFQRTGADEDLVRVQLERQLAEEARQDLVRVQLELERASALGLPSGDLEALEEELSTACALVAEAPEAALVALGTAGKDGL